MSRGNKTTAQLTGIFFILLLNHLLSYSIFGAILAAALVAVGAGFAWIIGGSVLTASLIMAGVGFVVYLFFSIRNSFKVLENFRGTGAYLYGLCWGGCIGN